MHTRTQEQSQKILQKHRIYLLLSLFFILGGCIHTNQSDKLVKADTYQAKKPYTIIEGTLSIVGLSDAYHRKRMRELFKLHAGESANIVFVDKKTKKLFVFNYFKSDKNALKDLFYKVKQTGFYDEKNQIEPVFKVTLQGVKEPLSKWGLNSGWQKVTKDPYQPYGFILKKVIKLEVSKERIPPDCYLKGKPCQ